MGIAGTRPKGGSGEVKEVINFSNSLYGQTTNEPNNLDEPEDIYYSEVISAKGGLYNLNGSFTWSYNRTNNSFISAVYVNGTKVDSTYFFREPKDSSGNGAGGTTQRYKCAIDADITLNSGNNTIELRFGGTQNNVIAAIHNLSSKIIEI